MIRVRKTWMLGLLLCACTAPRATHEDDIGSLEQERNGQDSIAEAPSSHNDAFNHAIASELGGKLALSAPSDAVTIELSPHPARPYYQPGQILQLQPVARDAQGERLLGIRFQYLPTPAQAVARIHGMPGRYELLEEGKISFEVCARADLCTSLSVVVDAGSPLLVVNEPSAGAQLGADGSDTIVVRGSVADARNTWVWVAGAPVEVDELGAFEAAVSASYGVNHIFVSTTDGVSEQAQDRRDVLWAEAYLPAPDSVAPQGIMCALPGAARLALGQSFFDDGKVADSSMGPRSDDVADLIALVVERAELTSLIPDPIVEGGDTLLLRVTDVRPRDVSVEMAILDGAIEMFVRVSRLEVDTAGGMDLAGTTVDLDGGLSATLSLLAQLSLRVGADSGVEVELSEFHTLLESVSSHFVAPEANAVFRIAESSLRTKLEEALSSVLAGALVGQLPRLLEDALGSVEQLLRDQRFTLSFAPLPEQTLAIDGRFAAATLSHGRNVRLELDAQVGSNSGPAHPEARGVAQRSATPVVETFDGRAMQLALRMDLVNVLLHTLWNGGLLEVRGADAKGSGALSDLLEAVTISGKLPPLLRAAYPWEEADAMLELGQLEVLFELGESSRYAASMALPVDVHVRDGALRLELGLPQIELWLIESTAETPTPGEELVDLVVPLLLPVLEDAINGNPVALDLPSLAPSELTEIAPSLAGFALSLVPGDDVVVRGDALIIDLKLVGAMP